MVAAIQRSMEGNASFVSSVRQKLGLTQAGLGRVLGASVKAVQSYEQCWRNVPTGVISQLLVLLALRHERTAKPVPCWIVTRCPTETRTRCPAFTVSGGRYCWMVSGRLCQGLKSGKGRPTTRRCADCPVVQRLL